MQSSIVTTGIWITASVVELQAYVWNQYGSLRVSTGTVTFYTGSTPIATVSFDATNAFYLRAFSWNLPAGTQDFWAQYNGDGSSYLGSSSNHKPLTFSNSGQNNSLTLAQASSGSQVVLTVTAESLSPSLTLPITGPIDFYAHGQLLGTAALLNNQTCSLSVLSSSITDASDIFAVYYGFGVDSYNGPEEFLYTVSESNHVSITGGFTPPPSGNTTAPGTGTPAAGTAEGSNRVYWGFESVAYTWANSGLEFKLKHLKGGEMWVDKVYGTVDIDVSYREDADPCWRFWFHTTLCVARDCTEAEPVCYPAYPATPYREGYRYPIVFPEPKPACDSMGIRPTTVGYQFQAQVMIRGWCRVRGLILYALPHTEPQYHGIAVPANAIPQGMTKLPNPFG